MGVLVMEGFASSSLEASDASTLAEVSGLASSEGSMILIWPGDLMTISGLSW